MGLINPHRNGFNIGVNAYEETLDQTGMSFDILVLNESENFSIKEDSREVAVIIIEGSGTIEFLNDLPVNAAGKVMKYKLRY